MSKSAASAETEEYERVRGQPFQKISGRPEWSDYMTMKKQAGKIAANAETGYSWGETTGGTQYGLLADIIGGAEYEVITGILETDYQDTMAKPALVDATITSRTTAHEREAMTIKQNELVRWWHIRRGLHRGLSENFRDALDEDYYEELEDEFTGYRTVKPIEFLDHLKTEWVLLDTKAKKKMRDGFFVTWDGNANLKRYGKELTKSQKELKTNKIVISDDEKLQWYIQQMYDDARFDQQHMTDWEAKPEADQTWAEATKYFENLIKVQNQYNRMTNRSNAKRSRYESANHTAETTEAAAGDELREYIENLASKDAQRANEAEEQLNKM